jgi:hypothetical protein
MKILFYTDIPRSFRSNLSAFAAEIFKVHNLVLLAEDIGENPFLGAKMIQVNQYSTKESLIAKNRRLAKLAKKVIEEERPDIVIAQGDYFFESYLRREARKRGIVTLSAMGPFFVNNLKEFVKYRYHMTTKGRGMLFAKIKKWAGHFLYYWILPILASRPPFIGHESSVLWNPARKKGADYYFVYSEKDRQVLKNSGADISNVLILTHPTAGRKISEPDRKTITIMEDGKPYLVKRNDFSLISEKKRREYKKEVVKTVAEILNEWKIYVKPHPKDSEERIEQMKEDFAGLAEVAGKDEPAEEYIKKSFATLNYVAGMAVFSAVLMQRPVIAVDWQEEFMADFYKDSEDVEYADTKEKLISILKRMESGEYSKSKKELKKQGFSSIVELLNYIKNK